ncbi:MAG: helix-turn-helix transcriptional regulator [Planctomycetota bacterium]|nr:helix-turn-helix transcriptional regulator [Planctomycetota bacterium]
MTKSKRDSGRPANAPRYGWSGRALLVARTRAKLRQSDLAYMIGVSAAAISQWESGHHAPTTDDARRIALNLGVTQQKLGRVPYTKSDLALLNVKVAY